MGLSAGRVPVHIEAWGVGKHPDDSPGIAAYRHAFIDAQNSQQLDDKSGCYSHDIGKRVALILNQSLELGKQ
jgi:hypothetical protein